MINEQALILSARDGNLRAFNSLITNHETMAFSTARRVLGDADLAADATQDAFIKAFRKLDQYRGGSFKAWLLRIVVNTCYDRLRFQKRRPSTSLENELEQFDRNATLRDPSEGPESTVLRHELRQQIETAIADLPHDQRIVIVLCDIEGFNYHEISDMVGIPLGTVKSRIARGRVRLRNKLVTPILQPQPNQKRLAEPKPLTLFAKNSEPFYAFS